ncbi:Uncharacterised protein [Streptococcus suis]|uniref:hypothetical protein n=1 Tax=Streptococcus suis TaxID=1307 RepID=UPI000698B1BB|nr:hypothetical protein [Streptococcus suis]CYU39329.1 Uncharacterised protein [Streptococcus suis]
MTRFYTNRSDFEQNHWLDSQKSRVVAMLRDIDSVSSTVQSEGLSHLYRSRGEAGLGASKPSSTFSQAVDRVDSMLRSAGKIHKDIVQNIDSKFTKGLDKSFQSLNEVNGSKNPYMSKGKYEKTYTTTNYSSNYGYVTQTHTRQVHYSLSDILDGTNSPIPAAQSLYQDRVKNLREQLRQTDQLTDKQIKELESKSDAELVQEFYPTLESDYSQIKNSTWQEENKEALGLVDTGLKFLAIAALSAGTLMTGGAALPLALAGGAYLFADGAHSAITGNTLITGTQLSTEDRIWAGAEAVVTLATFGSFAAGQSALRAGKQIPTTVQTIGKLAKYADEGVEALQWGSGVLQGDAANATLDYIGGKAFEGIVEGSVKGLQSQLSHIEVSSPSQIQLNARQGQDFVDLQTVEFGKIASKVENNITIKMTVDGVEQKIRVDAIGFDEAGNIRIQEYTTAQSGLKSSRQNILEDLSKYGGTIVGAGKGDFVGGVEIPKGTRIDVVSQKTGNVTVKDGTSVQNTGNFNPLDQEIVTFTNLEFSPTAKAQSWQGDGLYPGIDNYVDVRLNKGDKIYILESDFEVANKMQSGYATTWEAVERSGYDSRKLSESLQIKPYYSEDSSLDIAEYRQQVTEYTVISDDLYAAFGEKTLANPHFGKGGAPQYFVKDIQEQILAGKLSRGESMPLNNFEISVEEYDRMVNQVKK